MHERAVLILLKNTKFLFWKKMVFQVLSHVDISQDCKICQNKIHWIGIKLAHLDWHSMEEENKSFGKTLPFVEE